MITLLPFYRKVAGLIACMLIGSQLFIPPARAALVSTAQSFHQTESEATRDRLKAMLSREDIAQRLIGWGVDPDEARARVDTLNDAELAALSNHLESMPAGGGALEVIIISLLIAFLVLLLTDIAGYTDVFPFVK
jgi:hypothetical protein